MKATGIVRRIDDLGRVVIPKEIRRTMRIREGDPLEIFTDNEGGVIFRKYSPIGELGEFSAQYAEVLSKTSGFPVVVCDKDHVISVAGAPKRELIERRTSSALEELMEGRKIYSYTSKESKKLQPIEGMDRYAIVAAPIVAAGDVFGSIMLMSSEGEPIAGDAEYKLLLTAATFLGKQMEE